MVFERVHKTSTFRNQFLWQEEVYSKKVTVMPNVQSPKVKGSIWNIPISKIDRNFKSLSRPTIIVKMKRKVEGTFFLNLLDQG